MQSSKDVNNFLTLLVFFVRETRKYSSVLTAKIFFVNFEKKDGKFRGKKERKFFVVESDPKSKSEHNTVSLSKKRVNIDKVNGLKQR